LTPKFIHTSLNNQNACSFTINESWHLENSTIPVFFETIKYGENFSPDTISVFFTEGMVFVT